MKIVDAASVWRNPSTQSYNVSTVKTNFYKLKLILYKVYKILDSIISPHQQPFVLYSICSAFTVKSPCKTLCKCFNPPITY